MDTFAFEISKILSRRLSVILLAGTIIMFPTLVKVVSFLSVTNDNVPEGLFIDNVSFGIIAYTQTYLFLPLWILVLVGQELSNGHVNRVVFIKSRRFYFLSKLSYCGVVTLLFSVIGLISLIISVDTSPYPDLKMNIVSYLQYLLQLTSSILLYCLLLLSLVFFIRSPIRAFIVYFAWTFVEAILFSFFKGVYNIEMKWLPFHLIKTLYARSGEAQVNSYYNPFIDNLESLILPFFFITIVTIITYRFFLKSNLPVLSD